MYMPHSVNKRLYFLEYLLGIKETINVVRYLHQEEYSRIFI